jgi:hypothetical protein
MASTHLATSVQSAPSAIEASPINGKVAIVVWGSVSADSAYR